MKLDLTTSAVISLLVAVYFYLLGGSWWLLIFFPILGLVGMYLAKKIGEKHLVIYQLAKFCLIGALAALVDLLILINNFFIC